MTRTMSLTTGAALLATALAGPVAADRFADHPAPPYEGPLVLPDFDGAEADWRDFRTRIGDAARGGVTFAGHWTLLQVGCGTGCTWGVAIDLSDGSILPLPVSGEEYQNTELFAEPTSRLLKVTWTEGWPPEGRCLIGEFLLKGDAFRELRVHEHPIFDDCLR